MKIIIKIFLTIVFIFCFSCEEQGLFVKCSDCISDEPVKTSLEVKLSVPSLGFVTVVNVYEGNIEDSILYNTYQTTFSSTTIPVNLNKKYTLTATYYIDSDYYVAIDSATPRVKYDKSKCDDPCYFVYDKNIDLRLKYTK